MFNSNRKYYEVSLHRWWVISKRSYHRRGGATFWHIHSRITCYIVTVGLSCSVFERRPRDGPQKDRRRQRIGLIWTSNNTSYKTTTFASAFTIGNWCHCILLDRIFLPPPGPPSQKNPYDAISIISLGWTHVKVLKLRLWLMVSIKRLPKWTFGVFRIFCAARFSFFICR